MRVAVGDPPFCWNCGARMFTSGLRCEACGALKQPIPPAPPPTGTRRDAGHILAAAVLAASASLGILQALLAGLLSPEALGSPILLGCGCATIFAAIAALFGAYLAFLGDNWDLTLWCSIAAVFTIGPLFAASVLGAVAVALVATGRDRFYA